MLTSAYHSDGIDEHGHAINSGPRYAQWANAAHAAGSLLHIHNITTHTCEINGNEAHCESYVLVVLLNGLYILNLGMSYDTHYVGPVYGKKVGTHPDSSRPSLA